MTFSFRSFHLFIYLRGRGPSNRIRCFRFSNWFRSKKKRTKISYERSKNAMNFLCKSVFTIWNRKTICKRRFRSTLKQKFVSKNKNERSFRIRSKMKRNFDRLRWRIVNNRRFELKMKLNFWTIKWKKKNWRSFRFRSKKKRNHFVSSKNVRSYRFWSKMKRNFFVFRKMNFRSCRFRSKMKSNSRSRERTINNFRMKLKFRTIRKKKIWWKTSISKFYFSSLVADKLCFRQFDFKSKKIRWFFN